MRSPLVRAGLIVALLVLFVAGALFVFAGRSGVSPTTPVVPVTTERPASSSPPAESSPAAQAKPTAEAKPSSETKPAGEAKPAGADARPTTAASSQAKPTSTGAQVNPTTTPAQPQPTSAAAAPAKPADPAGVDRERMIREATWTPGQLASHFEKHGDEGPWPSESAFDASARETIKIGTLFTYVDRESNAQRLGFYDKTGNRFTSLTQDGRRITTHFRPDRGEAYVRNLTRSTYRS